MIEVHPEPQDIQRLFGNTLESCEFCLVPTRFWTMDAKHTVCPSCAGVHDDGDLIEDLYDKNLGKQAKIPGEDLSAKDVAMFCKDMNFQFYAVGEPENWEDTSLFRVSTHEVPARGYTVKFSKVAEWKRAMLAMGPRVVEGGRYRHYKGGFYTTVCLAKKESTGAPVIVYRGQDGVFWTRPYSNFFEIINDDGVLKPRFAHTETITD